MARLVLRDTVLTLAQVANRADKDVRSSHFERVTFADGSDFTGYDLRDCTFLDCRARGAILPAHGYGANSATEYIWSWHTDWLGAVLPANFSSHVREWVVELWRQAAVTRPSLLPFSNYLVANSDTFTNASNIAFVAANYTALQARLAIQEVYGPFPRLTIHATQMRASIAGNIGHLHSQEPDFVLDAEDGERFNRADLPTLDRFILANYLEQRLSVKKGTPWRVHIYSLNPTIWLVRAEERLIDDRWDWWPKWL